MSSSSLGCLGQFFRLFRGGVRAEVPPDVRVSDRFVTAAEGQFFRMLKPIVGNRGHILAQVSLRQLLHFPGNQHTNPGRTTWWARMGSRSIDFLICHPETLRPLVAIELDDSTHRRADRIRRDEQVLAVCEIAGLPLVRVPVAGRYDPSELNALISPHLGSRMR